MKRIKLNANFTVFLLFFGVATLEAFQTRNWIKAAFWLAIGLVFLLADNLKAGSRQSEKRWLGGRASPPRQLFQYPLPGDDAIDE